MIAMPPRTDITRRSTRRPILALLALAALVGGSSACAQSGAIKDLDTFPRGKLQIHVGKKPIDFDVWLADTPERQAQGLMFVRSLSAQRGMLFVHENPRELSMWMKNTYIPLDMVFIDSQGRIQQIVAQTTPHSLDTIRSDRPARAVLEIAGGEAQRLGLKPGQQVTHPAFDRR
jgi:uncharacterized membrane protein (UPF0127 family)